MGKTFALRPLLLCAGLDPRARVYCFDGKGTGDLSPCSLFAHFYSVGDEPEEIERVLDALRGVRTEMRRRARVVRALPHDVCPENKVTSALASRKDLRLGPIVIGIDETQAYFEYGDKGDKQAKAIREELAAIVSDLVKRGPALGIIVLLTAQNVNADTIPTAVSNNAVLRPSTGSMRSRRKRWRGGLGNYAPMLAFCPVTRTTRNRPTRRLRLTS